jgi:hypothetical protein
MDYELSFDLIEIDESDGVNLVYQFYFCIIVPWNGLSKKNTNNVDYSISVQSREKSLID